MLGITEEMIAVALGDRFSGVKHAGLTFRLSRDGQETFTPAFAVAPVPESITRLMLTRDAAGNLTGVSVPQIDARRAAERKAEIRQIIDAIKALAGEPKPKTDAGGSGGGSGGGGEAAGLMRQGALITWVPTGMEGVTMGTLRKPGRAWVRAAWIAAAAVLLGGCAEQTGRRQLERVAKDWCEAVRASQVIPVYPLTEDLRPGDVFMVQTPIQDQARIYRERGFLALDDLRHRLPVTSFKSMYFPGYWEDGFGEKPNPRPGRRSGSIVMEANAPRAAFPTYGFEARSGAGAALALPVKGIPVGLNFMNADRAEGTLTISDSRTYAAEAQGLYEQLINWAEQDQVRTMLAGVVDQVRHPVYLRVVTRVYLTGAVDVSLVNKSVTGVGLKAGAAPEVSVPDAEGTVNENHDRVLAKLNEQANAPMVRDVAGNVIPGAAVKFTSASARRVGLSEAFDTLLAIGYLGFDVPVFEGGVIGSPIPTFERLEHGLAGEAPRRVDVLSPQQAGFQIQMDAYDALARRDAAAAVRIAERTGRALGERSFGETLAAVKAARGAGPDEAEALARAAAARFKVESAAYVSPGGGAGPRYARYGDAFATAYSRRDEE